MSLIATDFQTQLLLVKVCQSVLEEERQKNDFNTIMKQMVLSTNENVGAGEQHAFYMQISLDIIKI